MKKRKRRSLIWTKEAREFLYVTLVAKFGPYRTWQKSGSPGRGRDKIFYRFCSNFSKLNGANGGDAVQQQIAFSCRGRGRARLGQCLAYNAILNMAAALHAGFILTSELPNLQTSPGSFHFTKGRKRARKRST